MYLYVNYCIDHITFTQKYTTTTIFFLFGLMFVINFVHIVIDLRGDRAGTTFSLPNFHLETKKLSDLHKKPV